MSYLFLKETRVAEELFTTHILGRNWWAPVNAINSISMIMYFDFFGIDVSKYLDEKFLEIIQGDNILGSRRCLVDALVVWALYKAGKHEKAEELVNRQTGYTKLAAQALFHYGSGNKQEAIRILAEDIPDFKILGGSNEQNQTITDCLGITRVEYFESIKN